MTRHRIYRNVALDAKEVVTEGPTGYDTDYNIQAHNDTGEWRCECGRGPFDSKKAAINHVSRK